MTQPKIEIYTLEWCPYCRKTKAFFKSKDLSYEEYDIADENNKQEMQERSGGEQTVPQIFIDGENIGGYDDLIKMKSSGELQEIWGMSESDFHEQLWDVTIIGAGPAGLASAVYAARKGLKVLVLAVAIGGQVIETDMIDNYIGMPDTDGQTLIKSFWDHMDKYEVRAELGERVVDIVCVDESWTEAVEQEKENAGEETKQKEKDNAADHDLEKREADVSEKNIFKLKLADDRTVRTKSVIVASGTKKRELGVPGENQFKNRGVHYCAICDGFLYAGEDVAVVGGGNSGLEAALDLAKLDCQVSLIETNDHLKGDKVLQEQVLSRDSIKIFCSSRVREILGDEQVREIKIRDKDTGEFNTISVAAVFVEIGLTPNAGFIYDLVATNSRDEIIIDRKNKTDVKGIWAAGDVTDIEAKQIIIATAEGARAALEVNKYLNEI